MWLLKLSSKSQECCLAKICSCRSLPWVRHSRHSRHGSNTGQVTHRACKGPVQQGDIQMVFQQICQVSLEVSSREDCSVCRTSLTTASCRDVQEMCSAGKKKHAPAARRDLVSFVLLLQLCSAPCTYLSRSALAGGFQDCQAASSPAQHLLKCLL